MKAHVALKGEPSLSTIDNFVLTGTFRMPVVLSEGSPFFFFFFFIFHVSQGFSRVSRLVGQGFSRVGQGSSHQEQIRFSNYNSCPTQFADNSMPVWALVLSLVVHYLRENPCTDPDVILFLCGPWPSRGCRNLGPSGPGPHES